ncbi:retron system putative HNH endonuclease [Sphingobacterium mizutaii]|uniref:retron system putative HNH endonuclease n=1 Tax=Sphingobacterium mizutaii TaxID=1010 RepID=UPI0016260572|nr:retron system putative HNH endonuclease [Sphingobacterium mizutaii]
MKKINKIPEPQSLIEHRANQPAFYDGLTKDAKDDLRNNLLREQGHICCYCLKRIPEKIEREGIGIDQMKVEHYKCQDNHPELQLAYSNLFGACTGNEGKPKKLQTCDTQKANQYLTINLIATTPDCGTLFKYTAEGEISSLNNDDEINRQLQEVLNLNMQTLKDGRRQVYLEVQKKVEAESRHLGSKPLKVKYFERERQKWLRLTNNKHKPFCMVAVYYLTKKIRQNS